MPVRIRKNDTVKVLSGKSKSKTGKVIRIDTKTNRAVVEQLNMVKKHQKPNQKTPQGGIIEKEAPIPLSSLQLVCGRCHKPTRLKVKKLDNEARVRVCKRCGEII